jgi:uncharacterized membrane protein YeaQ/YmgE (transglycosylase-associated protein family)
MVAEGAVNISGQWPGLGRCGSTRHHPSGLIRDCEGAPMILLFILVWGMFAGWIAHLLLARSEPVNWAELLVVGLAGSFVGGLLISLVSGDGLALRPSGIIGSILGAVVLLAAWRAIRPTARRRTR